MKRTDDVPNLILALHTPKIPSCKTNVIFAEDEFSHFLKTFFVATSSLDYFVYCGEFIRFGDRF